MALSYHDRLAARRAPCEVAPDGRYTVQSKDGPRAPWKQSAFARPLTLEQAQADFDDLEENGCGVFRVAPYKAR